MYVDGVYIPPPVITGDSYDAPTKTYTVGSANTGITEGVVSDAVSLSNKAEMQLKIDTAKGLGAEIFDFDGDIDAYFQVEADNYNRAPEQGIILPSDFHFKMHAGVNLRVQPTYKIAYALLCAHTEDNITITGGNLWGDRYTHDYTTITNTHEFGFGIYLRGAHGVDIDGVNIQEMCGDAIIVQSTARRDNDGNEVSGEYYNENWIIQNCTLNKSRRNNISLTDVQYCEIYNNTISNGGDGGAWTSAEGYNDKGVLPRYNIDLEAINGYNEITGEVYFTEIVRDVEIHQNDFTGAYNGDIDLYKCWDTEIHNNTFDASIANVASYNVIIRNNTFVGDETEKDRSFAIKIGERINAVTGVDFCVNYDIYSNNISGDYDNGIVMGATGCDVYSNTITNIYTGIQLLNSADLNLHDNTITSTVASSRGYYNFSGGITVENLTITDEDVDVQSFGMLLTSLNVGATSNEVVIDTCTFASNDTDIEFRNTHYVTVQNSTYSTSDFTVNGSSNITLTNNNL